MKGKRIMKQMLSAVLILAAATVYAVDFSPVNVGGIVSVAGKQDTLPYDTNAIPWSVIVQKPDIPTSSITNGLASESWVIGKNYVTESITNSLATVAHTGSYNDLSNKPTIPAPYVPSPTDATFSNAVLAVGLNIDTNSVAVLNEIAATFGGFPIAGTATTVGGLLAALAAAIAWLKKKKIDKITCSGVADITTENGTANVSTLFSSANTSLASTISSNATVAGKITAPSGGSAGNVLKKTESGVEWGTGGSGTQIIKDDQNGRYYFQVEELGFKVSFSQYFWTQTMMGGTGNITLTTANNTITHEFGSDDTYWQEVVFDSFTPTLVMTADDYPGYCSMSYTMGGETYNVDLDQSITLTDDLVINSIECTYD